MSYAELAQYGRLRKPGCCGPYSMFLKLAHTWGRERDLSPQEVAKKVKLFFRYDCVYLQLSFCTSMSLLKPILYILPGRLSMHCIQLRADTTRSIGTK